MAKSMTVTDGEFAEVVLQAGGLVMVDFWATFCAACRLVASVINELTTDYAGKVAIVKVNVDENPEYATQYQVRSTPTFIFFRDGQEVDRIVGAGKKPTYTAKLDALLNKVFGISPRIGGRGATSSCFYVRLSDTGAKIHTEARDE
jgi:thioredoxin 1